MQPCRRVSLARRLSEGGATLSRLIEALARSARADRSQDRHRAFNLAALLRARNLGAAAYCSRGGIGRRVRLRTVWGNPWRFESSREHFDYSTILISQQLFFSPPTELSLIAKASSVQQR